MRELIGPFSHVGISGLPALRSQRAGPVPRFDVRDGTLLTALTHQVLSGGMVPRFKARELSSISWALATLGQGLLLGMIGFGAHPNQHQKSDSNLWGAPHFTLACAQKTSER